VTLKRIIFFVLITLGQYSRAMGQDYPSLYFAEAQPSKTENLKSIPENFRGTFRHASDSLNEFVICADSIYIRTVDVQMMTRQEVLANKSLHLRDSVIYGFYRDGRPVNVIRKNDTLFFALEYHYTMFRISGKDILRACGNSLLISKEESKGKWTLTRLSFVMEKGKEVLEMAYIDHEEIKSLVESQKDLKRKSDQTGNFFSLSLNSSAMTQFMEGGAFNVRKIYYRQS
jgi:hypothetical protein